jgi:hypothetical protein
LNLWSKETSVSEKSLTLARVRRAKQTSGARDRHTSGSAERGQFMSERNKSVVWVVLLLVVVLAVMFIPAEHGKTADTLIFGDNFTSGLDGNKWDASGNYTVGDGLHMYPSGSNGASNSGISTKTQYNNDVMLFKVEIKAKVSMNEGQYMGCYVANKPLTKNIAYGNFSDESDFISVFLEPTGLSTGGVGGLFIIKYVSNTSIGNGLHKDVRISTGTAIKAYADDSSAKRIEILIEHKTSIFTVTIYNGTTQLYTRIFNDWHVTTHALTFGLMSSYGYKLDLNTPKLTENIYEDYFNIDYFNIYAEKSQLPSLIYALIATSIIAVLLIVAGSIVSGNCNYSQAIATTIGFTALLEVVVISLNPWVIISWAFPLSIITIWCLLGCVIHENWSIDHKYYESTGKVLIILAIIFTVLTVFEYFTLFFTKMYGVFWW